MTRLLDSVGQVAFESTADGRRIPIDLSWNLGKFAPVLVVLENRIETLLGLGAGRRGSAFGRHCVEGGWHRSCEMFVIEVKCMFR